MNYIACYYSVSQGVEAKVKKILFSREKRCSEFHPSVMLNSGGLRNSLSQQIRNQFELSLWEKSFITNSCLVGAEFFGQVEFDIFYLVVKILFGASPNLSPFMHSSEVGIDWACPHLTSHVFRKFPWLMSPTVWSLVSFQKFLVVIVRKEITVVTTSSSTCLFLQTCSS